MTDLADQKCNACSGGTPKMEGDAIRPLLAQLKDWKVVEGHHLSRDYSFPDFKSALDFVNKVGGIAEEEGHHPNIFFTWGQARIDIWTHKVDGLTDGDFVLAAKLDRLG